MAKVISGSGKRGNRKFVRLRNKIWRRENGLLGDRLIDIAEIEQRHVVSMVGLLGIDTRLACPVCDNTPLLLVLARLGWSCAECRRFGRLVLIGEDPAEEWTVLELITDGIERDD